MFGIGGVVGYHRVPLAKNVKSMLIGYSLYVSTSLILLALRVYLGTRVNPTWRILQPLSSDVALVVWTVGLWSYFPPATPEGEYEDRDKVPAGEHDALDGFRERVSLRQDT